MFKIWGLTVANCDAIESHTEREVYRVEDLTMKTALNLCPKCLLSQTKLRSKGKKADFAEATQS